MEIVRLLDKHLEVCFPQMSRDNFLETFTGLILVELSPAFRQHSPLGEDQRFTRFRSEVEKGKLQYENSDSKNGAHFSADIRPKALEQAGADSQPNTYVASKVAFVSEESIAKEAESMRNISMGKSIQATMNSVP